MTEKKPEQTPREKIARLAAMSPEEFNRFMHWNFNRICKESMDEICPNEPPADGGGK
jgi:hypothetical protein